VVDVTLTTTTTVVNLYGKEERDNRWESECSAAKKKTTSGWLLASKQLPLLRQPTPECYFGKKKWRANWKWRAEKIAHHSPRKITTPKG